MIQGIVIVFVSYCRPNKAECLMHDSDLSCSALRIEHLSVIENSKLL